MKRALVYFILGLGVAYFLFAGGIRTKVQLTDQAQQNISVLASAAMKVTNHVQSWLSHYTEDTQPVMSTLEPFGEKESLIDYDAALKIVHEIIEDLDKMFTSDQKQAIEKEVNELYKQSILKEYKDQIGPSYYE